MKILELQLRRIGPFTDRTLSFNEGKFGLHLVYGPNEGGKSSALRALTCWLFGFRDESKQHDFIHAKNNLRVGGTIESHDGSSLTFIRRPGGRTSLKQENDRTPIDAAELDRYLAGLTVEPFKQQFGINLEQLVAGGSAIASGGGDVGQSLFAAGSGAATVQAVQRALEAECDELFKPAGRTGPKINATMDEWSSARKTVLEKSIKSTHWLQMRDDLESLTAEKSKLQSIQIDVQSRRDRLQRIHDALPTIGQLEQQRARLNDYADVPRLRDGFTAERAAAIEKLAAAKASETSAANELASLESKLQQLGVPPAILDHASAVEGLFGGLKLYNQCVSACPELRSQQRLLRGSAKSTLQSLGLSLPTSDVDSLRIHPKVRANISELAQQRSGLTTTLKQTTTLWQTKTAELADAEAKLAGLSEPIDVGPMKTAIAAAQRLGDVDKQIDRLTHQRQRSRGDADRQIAQLPLWSGTLDQIETLSVPSPETVLRFGKEFEGLKKNRDQINDAVAKLDDDIATAEKGLRTIELDADVPTEQELRTARAQRDALWNRVATYVQDPASIDDDVRSGAIVGVGPIVDEFTEMVAQCDELGDRLRREASKVSEKARLIASLEISRTQRESKLADRETADSACGDLENRWRNAWAPAGIEPTSPEDMKGWLGQRAALVELAASLRDQQSALDQELETRARHRRTLTTFLVAPIDGDSLLPVLDACSLRLDSATAAATEHHQATEKLQTIRRECDWARVQMDNAETAFAEWKTDWDRAMQAIDGDGELSPSEASATLDAIDRAIQNLDQADELDEQWNRQNDQIKAFDADVQGLIESLGVESEAPSMAQVVADLHDRLKVAREETTTRNHVTALIQTLSKKKREATETIQSQTALLVELCREAGCDSADELAAVEQKSTERIAIERRISERESELRGLAQSADLDGFIEQAIAEDADTLPARIDRLSEELGEIENERSRVGDRAAVLKSEFEKIDGDNSAALANETVEEATARLRGFAEDYVRARLGAAMLRRSVARYRKQNQRPVMTRASELFSRLTKDAFSGLDTQETDDGSGRLVGVRADGVTLVGVDGMSEGTCDQLFLALRLASLELYLEKNPPIPFIVDDILSNFDNDRAAATIAVLGELSEKTQVIMFTHHQHLVDVAKSVLGPDVLFTQSIDGDPPAVQATTPPPKRKSKKPATAASELF